MKYISEISIFTILICVLLTVQSSPLSIRHTRVKRWFGRTTTVATTTAKPLLPNDLEIGECKEDDKLIYVDDTRIESNNATLHGVIEIYIDSPYTITCCKLFDLLPAGTGAFPSFNNATSDSGGPAHKFMKINFKGQKGNGMHFSVLVYGSSQKSESNS